MSGWFPVYQNRCSNVGLLNAIILIFVLALVQVHSNTTAHPFFFNHCYQKRAKTASKCKTKEALYILFFFAPNSHHRTYVAYRSSIRHLTRRYHYICYRYRFLIGACWHCHKIINKWKWSDLVIRTCIEKQKQ